MERCVYRILANGRVKSRRSSRRRAARAVGRGPQTPKTAFGAPCLVGARVARPRRAGVALSSRQTQATSPRLPLAVMR